MRWSFEGCRLLWLWRLDSKAAHLLSEHCAILRIPPHKGLVSGPGQGLLVLPHLLLVLLHLLLTLSSFAKLLLELIGVNRNGLPGLPLRSRGCGRLLRCRYLLEVGFLSLWD